MRDRGFGDQESACQINLEDTFPLGRIEVLYGRCRPGDACVADQDVGVAEWRTGVIAEGSLSLPETTRVETAIDSKLLFA
jgi:hypothetical protein